MREASITRKTAETDISVRLRLDGTGRYDNATGVGFFDHMLDQLARHALIDLEVRAEGDRHIDDHHTVEDTGITIGQALARALGDKRGIRRYGACLLPMDDALVRAALDLSGRPYLVWDVPLETARIGSFDAELVREFFQGFAIHAGLTLHVSRLARVQRPPRRRGIVQGGGACVARSGGARPAPRRRDPVDQGGAVSRSLSRRIGCFATRGGRVGETGPDSVLTVLIDFSAGNLHSAEKAFRRMAAETGAGEVSSATVPGTWRGPTGSCCPATARSRPAARLSPTAPRLFDALIEAVERKARPFLGICVGMQLMASVGREHADTPGFGWIPGRGDAHRSRPGPQSAAHGLERSGGRAAHTRCSTASPPATTPTSCTPTRCASPIRRTASPGATMAATSRRSSDVTRWSEPSSTPKRARRPACA